MYCHVLPYCLLDHLLQAGTDVILSKRTRRFKYQAMSSKQVTNVTSHGHASSKPPHHNISQYTDQIMSQHVTTCYCIRTVTLWSSLNIFFDLWIPFIYVHLSSPGSTVCGAPKPLCCELQAESAAATSLASLKILKLGTYRSIGKKTNILWTFMKTIDKYWNGMGEDIAMGRRRFAIWGYMRIWMNCCQPHTIHYPTLESSNQPEFHQKKPQSRSVRWSLCPKMKMSQNVPRWSKMSHWPVLPRLPPCTFLQLWINKQKRSRKSCRWEVTIWKSCMSHRSSARTLWRIGHIQLTCIKSSPPSALARPQRHPQKHKHVWNVAQISTCPKCLEMLSGSESPQSSKAPTRGDRLRSDIVQSEMSVPQILHVEWNFKATCTTQAMLLAPWKLLIPCGLFASRVIQSIFEANSLCFSAYLVSPVFTLFSPRFTEVTWGLGKSRAARGNGIGRWADEQMLLREATDFQRPNAINLHILMIHVFSVLSAVSLCEVTSL